MQHPFIELQSEYAAWLSHLSVTRPLAVDQAAKKILLSQNMDRYEAACQGTMIPPAFMGALDLRECECDPRAALGQGDPWNRVSTHVPRGCGPFSSWITAAKFYAHYDHLDDNTQPWTMEYAMWKGEAWNGFGPRAHGRRSGYLLSGTSLYDPPAGLGGKYVADDEWSGNTVDQQIGIVPVLLRIFQLRPSFALTAVLPVVTAPPLIPAPGPSPVGVGGGTLSTVQIQHALNVILHAGLAEDGDYGRRTRAAVRLFQLNFELTPDGLAGDQTEPAIEKQYERETGVALNSWTEQKETTP